VDQALRVHYRLNPKASNAEDAEENREDAEENGIAVVV
jgi:hypothetical protein